MKWSLLCALWMLLLTACSDDEDPAQPKPKPDAGETCNPHLAELTKSEKVWKQLVAEGGDDYWYEHENCLINSPDGQTFLVQVEGGKARKLSDRVIERDECEVTLNAYGGFGAVSFEQHYAMCRMLLAQECTANFATDVRGVLRTCQWEDHGDCFDNCGEGVHIRRWDFGQAP
jgi:hypothetical protein